MLEIFPLTYKIPEVDNIQNILSTPLQDQPDLVRKVSCEHHISPQL